MGWTYKKPLFDYIKDRRAACLAECRAEFSKEKWATVESDTIVNNVYYAAMKRTDNGEVFGLVVLVDYIGGEFCYKEMDETMHPYYYGCPAYIIKKLSPTSNELANEWRRKCLEKHPDKTGEAWKQGARQRLLNEAEKFFKRRNESNENKSRGLAEEDGKQYIFSDAYIVRYNNIESIESSIKDGAPALKNIARYIEYLTGYEEKINIKIPSITKLRNCPKISRGAPGISIRGFLFNARYIADILPTLSNIKGVAIKISRSGAALHISAENGDAVILSYVAGCNVDKFPAAEEVAAA